MLMNTLGNYAFLEGLKVRNNYFKCFTLKRLCVLLVTPSAWFHTLSLQSR